ncbi:MAG: hypothetical protein ABI885_22840 [Gammaproteobacteria bacterium]
MTNPNDTGGTKTGATVSSLRQLSQDVPPPRDLWPAISAALEADATDPKRTTAGDRRMSRGARVSRMQFAALAAVIAALAVGMWVGRNLLPVGGAPVPERVANAGAQELVAAAYVTDPRYVKNREAMIGALEAQLKTLPPQTQTKVAASLETIRKSMTDIQAALGRDPGNALLQELLVNTYQDEMRVLTAVHEASDTGREI